MSNIWGANSFGHDASLCVVKNGKVIWHKRSCGEYLSQDMVDMALLYGEPELICYYEKPWLKRTRQIYSGEYHKAFSLYTPRIHFYEMGIFAPIKYFNHHESHAGAGYYLSDMNECVILVADAIGEWDTISVWYAKDGNLKKLKSRKYPYSLGLFYSAFTKLLGFEPMKDENQLMKLSLSGDYKKHYFEVKSFLDRNLHKGISEKIDGKREDIAASVQKIFEEELVNFVFDCQKLSNNLIFVGGCAYNLAVVEKLKEKFETVSVLNNPGDFNSSVGAVGCFLKEKMRREYDYW